MNKTIFYYETLAMPSTVRIKSEALCLDHTCIPELSAFEEKSLSFDAVLSLIQNPIFEVTAIFQEGLYLLSGDKEVIQFKGLVHFDTSVELIPINEMPIDYSIID